MTDDVSSINIAQASSEVGNLVRMFKGVRDAQAVIDALATSEQRLEELRKATTQAKSALTRAQNDVEEVKVEAGRIRDDATFTLQAAQAERERILVDAREQAEAIVAAGVEAKQAADGEVASTRRELDGLRQQVGLVKGELARLESARKAVLVALTGAQERAVDVPPAVAIAEPTDATAAVSGPLVNPSE